jgi:hypothetical protein
MDTLTAIHSLKDLEPDWDSYGAKAPDEPTVSWACAYLAGVTRMLGAAYSQPTVQPVSDPGVSLIWQDRRHGAEEVEVLVTRTGAEWILLKDHRIMDHGPAPDPETFAREILKRHVSL